MLLSMTGFGKAVFNSESKSFSIEIKSLNSKQADINLRIPNIYSEKEPEIRNLLSKKLIRGKIDLFYFADNDSNIRNTTINTELAQQYSIQLQNLTTLLKISPSDDALLKSILSFPDVLKTDKPEINQIELQNLVETIEEACDSLIEYRKNEGLALQQDIERRVQIITEKLEEIEKFEEERIQIIKQRIIKNSLELKSSQAFDENRFEQEIIYYVEKLDITEEKVRLKKHCKYFFDIANELGENGKKLGFVVQEIGREINTIGSKANHASIQKLVVEMKDELEKIKEQLMNIL